MARLYGPVCGGARPLRQVQVRSLALALATIRISGTGRPGRTRPGTTWRRRTPVSRRESALRGPSSPVDLPVSDTITDVPVAAALPFCAAPSPGRRTAVRAADGRFGSPGSCRTGASRIDWPAHTSPRPGRFKGVPLGDLRRGRADVGGGRERCVEVVRRPSAVEGQGHRRAPYEEQVRARLPRGQFLSEVPGKDPGVVPAQGRPVQARLSAPAVIRTPCLRNAGGVSLSANARNAGRPDTSQPAASRPGSSTQAGTGQPSRTARCSTSPARAASTRTSPVRPGLSLNNAVASPPRPRTDS